MIGNVSITSIPSGAKIFINESDQKAITTCTVINVPVGENVLTLRLENFNDYTETIVVTEGQTINIVANLVPSQDCIYFVTTPPGATIFIDNQLQVNTNGDPIVTPALICGITINVQHTYRLILAEYSIAEGTFIGQGQTISTTLIICTSASLIVNPLSGIIGDIITSTATISPPGIYLVDFKDGTTLLQTVLSGIDGIAIYNWNTANVSEGEHNITVSIGQCISPSIVVNLTPIPIPTTINISPVTVPTLNIGNTEQFSAIVRNQFGNIIPNIIITWGSSDTTIGTISSTGLFTAIKEGTINITASIGTITSNTVQIIVAPLHYPIPTPRVGTGLLIGIIVIGMVMTSRTETDKAMTSKAYKI